MATKQELEAEAAAKEAAAKEAEAKLKADADEKAKADANAKAADEAKRNEGLVKMHKEGQVIHAHPTTVKEHTAAGWKHA